LGGVQQSLGFGLGAELSPAQLKNEVARLKVEVDFWRRLSLVDHTLDQSINLLYFTAIFDQLNE